MNSESTIKLDKELLRKIKLIEIKTKKIMNQTLAGEYASAFRGRGMEFDIVREYQEGDDPRTIDWNVTARTGFPYVKSFIEERELTLFLIVDISSSTHFGTGKRTKQELIAEFCALLSMNASIKNDQIGLILFSDQIDFYLPPKKGKKHVLRIVRELLAPRTKKAKTDLNQCLDFVQKIQKKKTVLFLVSDFLAELDKHKLSVLAKKHDLIAVNVFDQREQELERGVFMELQDCETGKSSLFDFFNLNWIKKNNASRKEAQQKLEKLFRNLKIDQLKLETNCDIDKELIHFFKKRHR